MATYLPSLPSTSGYGSQTPLICSDRIKKELREMKVNPKPNIFVVSDESDIRYMHALIIGPSETPYDGGFFYFTIHCTLEYPSVPPKVRLMTTSNGTVTLNPNMYADGTICLSILGTWEGMQWTPALTISTLLLSIQSLMNEKPYHNEPGFERGDDDIDDDYEGNLKGKSYFDESIPAADEYNNLVLHENIRVAVCEMLENSNYETHLLPEELKKIMREIFLQNYNNYVTNAQNNMHLNGSKMKDPFGENSGTFDFQNLLTRLQKLYTQLCSVQSPQIKNF